MLSETFEHLRNGRFRLALTSAQKVYEEKPDSFFAAICLAWALLENGNPVKALELANIAVELEENSFQPKLYRGFLLSRMSIFEGAIADLNSSIEVQNKLLTWTYLNKARSLAGLGRYFEALEEIDKAIQIDPEKNEQYSNIKKWYKIAGGLTTDLKKDDSTSKADLLEEGLNAFKQKEFWFSLFAARKILDDPHRKKEHKQALLLELESMYSLFQFKPAIEKANALTKLFKGDKRFDNIFNSLIKFEQLEEKEEKQLVPEEKVISIEKNTEFVSYPNKFAYFLDAKMFAFPEQDHNDRKYLIQFDEKKTSFVAAEISFKNPFYKKTNAETSAKSIWYLNNTMKGEVDFTIKCFKNNQVITFIQNWGTDFPGFWLKGQGKLEIYVGSEKVLDKYFLISDTEIIHSVESEALFDNINKKEDDAVTDTTIHPKKEIIFDAESLSNVMDNLDDYVGLNNVKKSIKDFISYLEFVNERKKLGLKTESELSFHCVFSGSPGTGKTSVARLLGSILHSMGLLEKGHLVEVDRSSLVGQYIGETAVKTNKIIDDALGGVLFIDDANTLYKKASSAQDFGQEAIDTLLKRMEMQGTQFAVVVAGYTEEMNSFLDSSPGLKSIFNRSFLFEDFTPDELVEIAKRLITKDDYKINDTAVTLLLNEITPVYRKRDKSFGNAKYIKKIIDTAKINLGKRYLQLSEADRTKEAMTTITDDDILSAFELDKPKSFSLSIDEEALTKALGKLNSLIGIESVKKEVNEMIKIARFFSSSGSDYSDKFQSHIVFLGNPGTGKTTVARILSEIYSALGILTKGHLVETDRQGLVSSYVGQTAKQTTDIINRAIGGTLFIDEAYSLVKQDASKSDFGQEAIDTLLKRMEDDRGKFLVIAAGYTEEMNAFLDSNPGMKSRFNKTIFFEDYSPDELVQITEKDLKGRNYFLAEDTLAQIKKHYNALYRGRDKTFGNARLARNLVETAIKNQLLRMVETVGKTEASLDTKEITIADIESIIKPEQRKIVKVEGDTELLGKYLDELHSLTGLDSVKKSVEKLINSLKVAQLRQKRGFHILEKNLHSVFTGNPGTGKTTVARLLSKIYKEMGLLEKGHLVEVKRSDLVAGYQGQTAIKTEKIIKQALGGTLFIDEAYTLSRGTSDFGQEAIDTLLKEMEDNRDKLVVIVAGYPAEMDHFLKSNPGLHSRFTNFFDFEDYNPRQLLEIAAEMANTNGYRLDEGALQTMLDIFDNLYKNRDKNFGNARTARNILYKAISSQEERISNIFNCSDEELITIIYEDVEKISGTE
ncbi:MAG: AAA family ATPase [Ignavibacteriales bacterium]|nr:MAG: AAA family ATPase [Ignavibacteriales bacterium]